VPIVIHTYTRAQASEDGVLMDVSEMAHGCRLFAVWAYVEPTPRSQAKVQRPGRSKW